MAEPTTKPRFILATDLIKILQGLVALHGPETGVEPNQVGNLLISDAKENLGYIEIRDSEYYAFDTSHENARK